MSVSKLRSKFSHPGLFIVLPLTLALAACAQKYSPDTYSSNAVQQASKVESGVVIGVRKVAISADPSIATATGAAAGGIAGSQVAEGAVSALSALGGAVVGGIAGSEAGHKMQDTFGYEYIVRNTKGDLLSVTQKDTKPLKIGQRVLLIQGSQARIVNDYTEHVDTDANAAQKKTSSPGDDKQDMSKAAGKQAPSDDFKTPSPAAQTETEKLINAATVAAIAALAAQNKSDSKEGASAAAASNAATAQPATPAAAATPAPASEAEAEKTAPAPSAPAKDAAESQTRAVPADSSSSSSVHEGETLTRAPSSTIIVPDTSVPEAVTPEAEKPEATKPEAIGPNKTNDAEPTQTKPDTPPASAPAANVGAKDTATKDTEKPASKAGTSGEQTETSNEDAKADKSDESNKSEGDASSTPPDAKKDDSTAH